MVKGCHQLHHLVLVLTEIAQELGLVIEGCDPQSRIVDDLDLFHVLETNRELLVHRYHVAREAEEVFRDVEPAFEAEVLA